MKANPIAQPLVEGKLLALLATLEPLKDDLPLVEEQIQPLDDVALGS